MAGIGVRLTQIYEKNTVLTDLFGFAYSTMVTVAPMFAVIGEILLSGYVLGLNKVGYAQRELFACTVLYIFIFSLLTASPFNAVLSRYMSDVIYEEQYEDILPCFYIGLLLNMVLGFLLAVPFCIHEYRVGHVPIIYVLVSFCGFMSLLLVFYAMLYLSICKDYKRISVFFFSGMLFAFLLSLVFHRLLGLAVTDSMLASLVAGFMLIACEELAIIKRYFKENSGKYRPVFRYMREYWPLIATNFLYTLGLYIHNFIFWTTDLKMVVAKSFVCAQPYDLASCLAMFTNISATVIFISRVEMHFHDKYKGYSEAVIGGRGIDIINAQKRMFRQLAAELMNLARIQFIISIVLFLLCVVILPQYGFSGMVMQIYPCLAAGYFSLFMMYSAIIFLYYFNDLVGSTMTAVMFVLGTGVGSVIATGLSEKWYGIGVVIGSLMGWSTAYYRLRWVERNTDVHIFCRGTLLRQGKGEPQPSKVYDKRMPPAESMEEESE